MKLRLGSSAKKDVRKIWGYYEGRRPGLGDEFLEELTVAIHDLKGLPNAWPEFERGTRRLIMRRFPYAVVYRLDDVGILVIVVGHLARGKAFWKRRLTKQILPPPSPPPSARTRNQPRFP